MSTAVCIVPPDDAWDAIQRARHLGRDTTFYRWPPAIRLFHPFAPKGEIPSLVGRLAEWIEDEMEGMEENDSVMGTVSLGAEDSMMMSDEDLQKVLAEKNGKTRVPPSESSSSTNLEAFEVTLDSIQILPHWEVLDARIEALEERLPQRTLGESREEKERNRRRAEGRKLIEEEEQKGMQRKRERERKKRLKREKKERKEREMRGEAVDELVGDGVDDSTTEEEESGEGEDSSKKEGSKFNGPCVIYLSPNDESRARLVSLRERLREQLFPSFDAFSPSSSVSPYPEQLPRKVTKSEAPSEYRPLLPIARFSTVEDAVKVARVLQQTWNPLTFNVTDIQFVSRDDSEVAHHDPSNAGVSTSGIGFGGHAAHADLDIPEVRHRRKHGTLSSSKDGGTHQRMALTTSGEVDDVSRRGVYGCDAMVMLWGEEPEEELMDEEASLSMIMDDDEDEAGGGVNGSVETEDATTRGRDAAGRINYDEVFATAEREYQRMQAHEELSTASYVGSVPIFDSDVTDIEAWLDDEDDAYDDEGATVVIGRAQFFMGAMRDFVGMPASSAIDSKDRIMSGGVSAVARRRGAAHRLSDSWDAGDYGRKEMDRRASRGKEVL